MATDGSRLDVLRRRVQEDPASIAFGPLAEELRRSGEHYEAVRVCLAGLEHHPTFLSARVTLGRALTALDQYQEARTEFEYVLSVAPDNLLASRSLAELEAQCLTASPQPNPSLEDLEAWLARIEADRAKRASGGADSHPAPGGPTSRTGIDEFDPEIPS